MAPLCTKQVRVTSFKMLSCELKLNWRDIF